MKTKEHCGECKFLKFVDGDGMGYCDLLEEADVCVTDEACVEFIEDEGKEERL